MLNIVIPMAGLGSRFSKQGYKTPKPLIQLNGKHMIEGVIENLTPNTPHRFIFICQKMHLDEYKIEEKIIEKAPGSIIIPIQEHTQGAACTVLIASDYIDNEDELMIANSDQWIDFDINHYLEDLSARNLDALIMTMRASDPKWSYVRLDDSNYVIEAVEKEVVSNEATVGIYNFRKGSDFCRAASKMITSNKLVNGEFYVAPVYNELVNEDYKIGIRNIGSENNGMYGIGTPEDLKNFLDLDISKNF